MNKLEWYVFIDRHDEFIEYNCLAGYEGKFYEMYREHPLKRDFLDALDLCLKSRYWSRCEYEMILTSWPRDNVKRKVDIYDQIKMNWKHFSEYVWEWVREFE